jgi:hypothetical protein
VRQRAGELRQLGHGLTGEQPGERTIARAEQLGDWRRAFRVRPWSWRLAGDVAFSHAIADHLASGPDNQRLPSRMPMAVVASASMPADGETVPHIARRTPVSGWR